MRWCGADAYVTQARVLPLTRPVIDGPGSVRHIENGKLSVPSLGGVSCCRSLRPSTIQHIARTPTALQQQTTPEQKKKQNCRTICERSHRSPQPQRPNVVSEWARKRKRTGSHIERVRTDAGCRGEALTQSQSDSDVCTGLSRHRQFADLAERLRHENGKMICCPADRILHGEGGSGAKNHPPEKCGCALRRFSPSSRNCALLRRG